MRKATEDEVQVAIIDALHLAGLGLFCTSAHRQKGASGVDRGIPDLLVFCDLIPYTFLGLEVKRPEGWKWSSREQELAFNERRFYKVHSPSEAMLRVWEWLDVMNTEGLLDGVIGKVENVFVALGGER